MDTFIYLGNTLYGCFFQLRNTLRKLENLLSVIYARKPAKVKRAFWVTCVYCCSIPNRSDVHLLPRSVNFYAHIHVTDFIYAFFFFRSAGTGLASASSRVSSMLAPLTRLMVCWMLIKFCNALYCYFIINILYFIIYFQSFWF